MSVSTSDQSFAPVNHSHQFEQIKTCEVKNKESVKQLKKVCKNWQNHASLRTSTGIACKIPKDKISQLEDSELMTEVVKDRLRSSLIKKSKLYIARDTSNIVQGIAIVSFKKKNKLKHIVSNPENLPLFGYEQSIRGTGTGLLTQIFQAVLDKGHKKKPLRLDALSSAIPFYEKAHFTFDRKAQTSKKSKKSLTAMIIQPSDMQKFVDTQTANVKIQKKEPDVSKLKYDKSYRIFF